MVPIYNKKLLICSKCGKIIGEDRLDDIPIGTVFALKRDGFKRNRVFCSQIEFEKFYEENPSEYFTNN
jgi:RNA polymerase-binding transcription factor DksA